MLNTCVAVFALLVEYIFCQSNSCVTLKDTHTREDNVVLAWNSAVTLKFTVSETCQKQIDTIQILVSNDNDNEIFCYFIQENGSCVDKGPPCSCDATLREYVVSKHVSGDSDETWTIKGTSWIKGGNNNHFSPNIRIRKRFPPEVCDLSIESDTYKPTSSAAAAVVYEQSEVVVRCVWLEGNPPQRATLKKDGKELPVKEISTTVQLQKTLEHTTGALHCGDGGSFTCEVPHASEKASIMLQVYCHSSTIPSEQTSANNILRDESSTAEVSTSSADGLTQSSSTVNHTVVLYIGLACVLFLLFAITVVFGVLFRRKGLLARQKQECASCDNIQQGADFIQMRPLPTLPIPVVRDFRESFLSDSDTVYAKAEESSTSSSNSSESTTEDTEEDSSDAYFNPIASAQESATPWNAPTVLHHSPVLGAVGGVFHDDAMANPMTVGGACQGQSPNAMATLMTVGDICLVHSSDFMPRFGKADGARPVHRSKTTGPVAASRPVDQRPTSSGSDSDGYLRPVSSKKEKPAMALAVPHSTPKIAALAGDARYPTASSPTLEVSSVRFKPTTTTKPPVKPRLVKLGRPQCRTSDRHLNLTSCQKEGQPWMGSTLSALHEGEGASNVFFATDDVDVNASQAAVCPHFGDMEPKPKSTVAEPTTNDIENAQAKPRRCERRPYQNLP